MLKRAKQALTSIRTVVADAQRLGMQGAQMMANGDPDGHVELQNLQRSGPVPAQAAATARAQVVDGLAPPGMDVRMDYVHLPAGRLDLLSHVLATAGVVQYAHAVYGVFPVPDRLWPGRQDGGTVEEWCVVHAAGPGLAQALQAATRQTGQLSAGALDVTTLPREATWFDRPRSDPNPFDEDAAAAFAATMDLDPGSCLGMYRALDWTANFQAAQPWTTVVPTGVRILARAGATGDDTGKRFLKKTPVRFPADERPAWVEVLNGARLVFAHRYRWTDPPAQMTDLPQLPADPLELLWAYLRIVGLAPHDTYGVSVTVREDQFAHVPSDAVGAERGRAATAATAVYRDRPEYEAGRERFARWAADHVGMNLIVQREQVGKAERATAFAAKVQTAGAIGAGNFREHGIGGAFDAAMFPYCGGGRPRTSPTVRY